MTERKIQTLFLKHLRSENSKLGTICYELKICKQKSFAFDKVADHQLENLQKVVSDGLVYKLPDMPHFAGSRFRFDIKKPFDCIYLSGCKAYIGICFYKPRKPKELFLIDIDRFILEKKLSKRKSVKEEDARNMASQIVVLK